MFFGLLGTAVLWSQEYLANITYFDEEDGLRHREVNDITEDCQGLIWMATKQGLNRFDGHKFELWTQEKDYLLTNYIGEIYEDAQCFMWLVPFDYQGGDINLLNHKTGQITSIKRKYGDSIPFPLDDIGEKVFQTYGREIVFGSRKGGFLVKIDQQDNVQVFDTEYESIVPVAETHQNNALWAIAERNIIVKISVSGQILEQYPLKSDVTVRKFSTDVKGNPYFETLRGVFTINEHEVVQLKSGDFPFVNSFKTIYPDLMGGFQVFDEDYPSYWIFSFKTEALTKGDNMLLIDKDANVLFSPLQQQPDIGRSGFRNVFVDSKKRTWIGGNYGVYVLEVTKNNFSNYLTDLDLAYEVSTKSSRGLVRIGEYLYVNIEVNGLFRIHLETGDTQWLLGAPELETWATGLCKDDGGSIWVGSQNEVICLDPQTGLVKRSYEFVNPQDYSRAWTLYFDGSESLWVGTEFGIWYLEKNGESLIKYNPEDLAAALNDSHVLQIGEIEPGLLLVATNNGLYELDIKHNKGHRYWTGGKARAFLPHDDIQCFYRDEQGIFWLGTNGGGLLRWDRTDHSFREFNKNHGLSNEVIYAIYPDQHHQLWMSTDFGIIQFDKSSYQSRAFLQEDGTSHYEFNRTAYYRDEEGGIFFGSLNGVTKVDPAKFEKNWLNTAELSLKLISFNQFDGERQRLLNKTQQLIENNEIRILPGDRFFQLEFSLLDFLEMDKVSYAYMVEGLDNGWNYQKENYLRLFSLPYGNYDLRIKGQAPNGQWSSNEICIPIKVIKPVYLRTWFLVLSSVLVVCVGVIIYYLESSKVKKRQARLEALVVERTRQILEDKKTIEKQSAKLKRLDELKSRFFANVSHEFRTPLTLILGPIGAVLKKEKLGKQEKGYLTTAYKSGKNLLQLVNEILDLTKLESGTLITHEEVVNLYDYVKRTSIMFESYARQKGLQLGFKYVGDKNLKVLLDTDKFEKIFNNLMSNAIKFTDKGGKIEMKFKDLGDFIEFQIIDSGVGIPPEDLSHIFERFYQSDNTDQDTRWGTGIGLAICTEMTRLLKGNIRAESKLGQGSTFTVEIPKKIAQGESLKVQPLPIQVDEQIVKETHSKTKTILPPKNGKSPKILIVEDNRELNDYLKKILEDSYQVERAYHGLEALDILHQESKVQLNENNRHIDLIVSDVMMPQMDGFELLKKLKSTPGWNSIPIIILTARAGLKDKLYALRTGVDDYMIKPFEQEELLARVENLLNNRKERQKYAPKMSLDQNLKGLSNENVQWLSRLEQFVQKNIGNFDLSAEMIASEMALSRSQLFRKLKYLTGLTPIKYVQEIRFNHARALLENKTFSNVKPIAYEVGFKQVKYFSQQFKKRFGKTPSSYLE